MGAKFGPAGTGGDFKEKKYKSSLDVPKYVSEWGLEAYEYQCGHGVSIGEEKARQLGELAKDKGIALSLHAPYYISLASAEEEKRDNSIGYIIQSARAADAMGATRIVIHPGGKGKFERNVAVDIALDTFKRALEKLDDENLGHITLCPETMGKINQLGDLDEIMRFCKLDERVIPCIDFGHLNARTCGGLKTLDDFKAVFDKIENEIGIDRLRRYHAHFSKIEYSASGEVRHLTFEDNVYGPEYDGLIEMTLRKNCSPIIICESAGTQAADAATLKSAYLQCKEERQ